MNLYPALKQPLALKLIEIDFKILYPEAFDKIFSHWDEFVSKLKLQFDVEGIKLSGPSDAHILRTFVRLFQAVPVKVPKGKPWKAAREEILDGFLIHIKTIDDFVKTNDFLKSKNKAKGLPLQPYPMIVGKT